MIGSSRPKPTLHLCIREFCRQVARGAADAAADIQDPLWADCARPPEHFVYEVEFGLLEVFLLVTPPPLLLRVVAQMNVVAPVVLQDPLPEDSPPRASLTRAVSEMAAIRRLVLTLPMCHSSPPHLDCWGRISVRECPGVSSCLPLQVTRLQLLPAAWGRQTPEAALLRAIDYGLPAAEGFTAHKSCWWTSEQVHRYN